MKNLVVILIIFLFTGCLKDEYKDYLEKQKEEEEFYIDVPSDFTWSGVFRSELNVEITEDNNASNALDGTQLELYDLEGNLLDALIIENGNAVFSLRIPSSQEKLILKSPASEVEQEILVTSENVTFDMPAGKSINLIKTDSDNDGLFDMFDVNPYNKSTAITINKLTQPGLKKASNKCKSFVIFEDLWPWKGDYDFNDLIIETDISMSRGWGNYISTIEVKTIVNHIGAGFQLGLGYELFEAKGSKLYYIDQIVKSVEGTYSKLDDKVKNGVIVFENEHLLETYEVVWKITLQDWRIKSFELLPYLFYTNDPSHQVRVFGTPPTINQNMSLFRTNDDKSPNTWSWYPGTGFKYPLSGDDAFYRSNANYPWGIEFMAKSFKATNESNSIVNEYPMFKNWAESGGNKNKDWYDYPQ